MSVHVNMCVFLGGLRGVQQGALAVGLVYVARRLKVRGEGGGAWAALGPLKSPTPFSHLTNGRGDVKSESVFHPFFFPQKCTVRQHGLEIPSRSHFCEYVHWN